MNSITQHRPTISIAKPYNALLVTHPRELEQVDEGSYALAVIMDLSDGEILKQKIPLLINGNRPFLIILKRSNGIIDPVLLELFINCLFSIHYLRKENLPIIGFVQEKNTVDTSDFNFFSEYIISKLQLQGWSSVVSWSFNSTTEDCMLEATDNTTFIVQDIPLDEQDFFQLYLSDFDRISDYILFCGPSFQDAVDLEHRFFKHYSNLLSRHPIIRNGIERFISEKNQLSEHRSRNSDLEEKLANAEKTIEVIRTKYKDDYENLFKWYHNEYEILPLWYKRCGQILKVLMGKRTFRSLFSDDVKKYKT